MKIIYTQVSIPPYNQKQKNIFPFKYCIGDTELNDVKYFGYLGVTLSEDLTWTKHFDTICVSAYQKFFFFSDKLKRAAEEIKTVAYKTYLRLILEYGSVVWDPHTKRDVDR